MGIISMLLRNNSDWLPFLTKLYRSAIYAIAKPSLKNFFYLSWTLEYCETVDTSYDSSVSRLRWRPQAQDFQHIVSDRHDCYIELESNLSSFIPGVCFHDRRFFTSPVYRHQCSGQIHLPQTYWRISGFNRFSRPSHTTACLVFRECKFIKLTIDEQFKQIS